MLSSKPWHCPKAYDNMYLRCTGKMECLGVSMDYISNHAPFGHLHIISRPSRYLSSFQRQQICVEMTVDTVYL